MNKKYMKGYRKERKIVNDARAEGYTSFRSAGSHSPVDVVIIDQDNRRMWLVQAKAGEISPEEKVKLHKDNQGLNGMYYVMFKVL